MTSFLFWNLNGKPLESLVANLARRHEVDVIMLAECETAPARLLRELNRLRTEYHYVPQIGCSRIQLFTRFPGESVPPVWEEDRLSLRHLKLPGLTDILLAVVHFPGKLHFKTESQAFECAELARVIRDQETRLGHSRTVLVGDLNMNPFESGMVSANGLHAVMTREIARGGSRMVQGREYPFFYNPMWSFFGDNCPGPPGTYYYHGSEHVVFFWHMFDQVMVRPDLLDRFDSTSLEILATDGQVQFLSEGNRRPNTHVASDHLPITFCLDL